MDQSLNDQTFQPPEAIILAGGLGTRLRSILPNQQKVVALIEGKPFLHRILLHLHASGIRRVILALGYQAEDVIGTIHTLVPCGMTVEHTIEKLPMGTGGAIRHAMPLITTNEIVVVNGDSFVNYPVDGLINFHRKKLARASMLLCEVPDVTRFGTVTIDDQNRIVSFQEKVVGSHNSGIINAGVYVFNKKLVSSFPLTPHSLEVEVLPGLCGNGFFGLETRAEFIDIGTPQDYAEAGVFFSMLE